MCSEPDTFVQTLKDIKMKKVIIIGATSGIGKGLAERFLREGNTVGITGRREDKLQEICSLKYTNLYYKTNKSTVYHHINNKNTRKIIVFSFFMFFFVTE